METRPSEKAKDVREEHPLKAETPMAVTGCSYTTSSRLLMPLKALSLTVVLLVTVTLVKETGISLWPPNRVAKAEES